MCTEKGGIPFLLQKQICTVRNSGPERDTSAAGKEPYSSDIAGCTCMATGMG